MKLVQIPDDLLNKIKGCIMDEQIAELGFTMAGRLCENKAYAEFSERLWVIFKVNEDNTVYVIVTNDLGNGHCSLVYHDMHIEEVMDIATTMYDNNHPDKEFIGETGSLCGNVVYVKVLGNHLPKDNPGYNHCIELICKDYRQAMDLYCRNICIKVKEYNMVKNLENNFMKIKIEDCNITFKTDEEVYSAVRAHKIMYEETN